MTLDGVWSEKVLMNEKRMEYIKRRLAELDVLIRETKARLPAHSVKPPVMMDLLALEDEYEALLAEQEQRI